MGKAVVERYNKETGDSLGLIEASVETCSSEYALYGGCKIANLEFVVQWGIQFVTGTDEELVIFKDGIPVFAGTVASVEPFIDKGIQRVSLDGWVKRLDELTVVDPPTDRLVFGTPDGDFPLLTRVFDVVTWLVNNRILPDPKSPITAGLIQSATYSAKLGPSGFVIYANDKISKVLETLATMDDCIYGVDAERKFYFFPRSVAEGNDLITIPIAEAVPVGWKNQTIGVIEGGRFIQDRRGPSFIAVRSRDIAATPGTRMYRLAGAYEDGTRKVLNVYSPNIRHGYAARRYARGLFRRYNIADLKVEDVSFLTGPRRLEPHLGAVTIKNFGDELTRQLAGSVSVEWSDVVKGSLTLGENKPDPGSGNPANDPYTDPDDAAFDSPQIDTGDSATIDLADGFDGDGDELHQDGIETLDYGEDTIDPTNGANSAAGSSFRIAEVTGGTHPAYDLNVFKPENGTEVEKSESGVPMEPAGAPALVNGQRVIVGYLTPTKPVIMGLLPARGMFLKVKEAKPLNKYDIDVLSPSDGVSVLTTFEDCEPWPRSAYFSVGQETFGYWFNGADRPSPVGAGGCCNDHYYFVGQVIKD